MWFKSSAELLESRKIKPDVVVLLKASISSSLYPQKPMMLKLRKRHTLPEIVSLGRIADGDTEDRAVCGILESGRKRSTLNSPLLDAIQTSS